MGQTIVVAGGAGFLGSHLCRLLLAQGNRILSVDDLSTGRDQNIEDLRLNPQFSFLKHDVRQPLSVNEHVDAVCNLASPASPPAYMAEPIFTLQVGSRGTENLIELAMAHNARFLLASTSEVYGDPTVHPQPETYWGNVNPIGPRSVYDEAKRYAEALSAAYERSHGLTFRHVRIFNTYGPSMQPDDGRVVTNFIAQAINGQPLTVYGDGTQTRSFCYVSDLVDGIARLLFSDVTGPVNIGNPGEFTMIELAKMVLRITGSNSELIYSDLPVDDPMQRQPEITRARTLLGWEPQIALEEGLQRTIAYFKELGKT